MPVNRLPVVVLELPRERADPWEVAGAIRGFAVGNGASLRDGSRIYHAVGEGAAQTIERLRAEPGSRLRVVADVEGPELQVLLSDGDPLARVHLLLRFQLTHGC